MPNACVEVVSGAPCELGEGCLWDTEQRRLYWVDILANQVFCLDPNNGEKLTLDVGENVGAAVLTRNERLLLALRSGFAVLDLRSRQLRKLASLEPSQPGNRLNDGKCDPQGRFWAGTMVEVGKPGSAGLFCLHPELTVAQKLDGLTISNGLAWTLSGDTFYHTDTPTGRVCAFDYIPESGDIARRRVVAEIPGSWGLPDGMTVDTEGQLWLALWGGGRVIRIDPSTSAISYELLVPAKNVTSCTFGGDFLDELYITTASVGMSKEERARLPLAGALFRAHVPFQGFASTRFAGEP